MRLGFEDVDFGPFPPLRPASVLDKILFCVLRRAPLPRTIYRGCEQTLASRFRIHSLENAHLPQSPPYDCTSVRWHQHQTLHNNHYASSVCADPKVVRLNRKAESAVREKDRNYHRTKSILKHVIAKFADAQLTRRSEGRIGRRERKLDWGA